ncbi:hypothetical protein C8R47DRAFT_35172 [Mycena vitilis]|nr:hypothetical protein C8R47DRAFT_35172 [Mycena vitilis]
MDNPIVHKILQFLRTGMPPLMYSDKHVPYSNTSHAKPILYDSHMPPQLRLQSLRYDPELSSRITDHFIESLAERKTVKDGSMDVDGLRLLFYHGSKTLANIIYRAVSEETVNTVQLHVHSIAGMFATLACFDVDNNEVHRLPSVFVASACPESFYKADRLVGCRTREADAPERWGSLWSSLAEPRDLSHPHFDVLYTEEYKNILAGHPRTILGIYIIIWCLEKGYLETFWPDECHGCPAFRRSHQAEQEAADDSGLRHEAPVDSHSATENLTNTNFEVLKEAIGRLITLTDVYKERYNIPIAEREDEDEDMDDEEPTAPAESTEYEHILEGAMKVAIDELNLPPAITDGLLRSVLDAAYFLIEIWGQMVQRNGTVAHFTCHNLGLIMARHRETQSMAVSKFLEYPDAPLLRAAALTVYAYHDAAERYDEHQNQDKPFWTEDFFRRETHEVVETEKKWQEHNQDFSLCRVYISVSKQRSGICGRMVSAIWNAHTCPFLSRLLAPSRGLGSCSTTWSDKVRSASCGLEK